MTEFLSEVRGFTPVIDVLAEDLGAVPALVYGVVWRFCQMRDGVCRASMETLAKRVGLNRATVLRHIKRLCEAGYLEDTTPDRQGAPHIYRDTGRVIIRGLVEARLSETVAQSNSLAEPVAGCTPTVAGCTPTCDSLQQTCDLELHKDSIKTLPMKPSKESIISPGDQNESPFQGGAETGEDEDSGFFRKFKGACARIRKVQGGRLSPEDRQRIRGAMLSHGPSLFLDALQRTEQAGGRSLNYVLTTLEGLSEEGRPKYRGFDDMTDEERIALATERNKRYKSWTGMEYPTAYEDPFTGEIVETKGANA